MTRKNCGLDYPGLGVTWLGAGGVVPIFLYLRNVSGLLSWRENKKYKYSINYYLDGVQTEDKRKACVLREAEQKHPSRPFTKEERLCKLSELFA
jgi:hypothetical protein